MNRSGQVPQAGIPVDVVASNGPPAGPDRARSRARRFTSRLAVEARPWFSFALACAVVFGLRWHVVDQVVVNWDESVYSYVAYDMATGGSLYRTAWDHKGPVLFASYVPPLALAGPSIRALRLYTTGLVLLTMLLVELLARRLFGRERAFIAPTVYGLFFCVPHFGGLASGAELIMMLPVSLALLLLASARESRWPALLLLLSGMAVAAGGLVKGSALYSGLTIPLVLLVEQLGEARRRSWRPIRGLGWFGFGFLACLGGFVGAFTVAGRLDDFLFANWFFNARYYVSAVPSGELGSWLPAFVGWAVRGDPFTALALGSAVFLLWKSKALVRDRWTTVLVAALLLTSFFGFTLGRRLFFHYYLQMALPFALLICWAVACIRIGRHDVRRIATISLVLGAVAAFSAHRDVSGVHSRDPKTDATLRSVAAVIRRSSTARDTIYVLGGEPALYLLADRRSPTRFFWWVQCTDPYDAGLASRRETLAAFARTPPKLFVYKRSDPRIVELERLMTANYVPIATVDDYQIAARKGS